MAMRSTFVVSFLALAAIGIFVACSPSSVVADASADGAADGPGPIVDASLPDTTPAPDASVADGSADASASDARSDAGLVCGALGGTYTDALKLCTDESDCAMVARGCYCGAQPVLGISKSSLAAAEACEAAARKTCALGCPNAPGRVSEDGKSDLEGGTISVRCELGKCRTVLP